VLGPVNLTQRRSLVLEVLELEGALVIRAGEDGHVTVDGVTVQNEVGSSEN
jgi:hypothetical protein